MQYKRLQLNVRLFGLWVLIPKVCLALGTHNAGD
jgi:hypothetical protein